MTDDLEEVANNQNHQWKNDLTFRNSIPNFRPLHTSISSENCAAKPSQLILFRSSRPDYVEQGDVDGLRYRLGIQSILDFRSQREYFAADGNRLLDREYHICIVNFPQGRNYHPNESVVYETTTHTHRPSSDCRKTCSDSVDNPELRHYLIDFFPMSYVWQVLKRAPWYIRICSILLFLFDQLFGTEYKYCTRLFVKTINRQGLIGQYKDIIEFSQRSICAALKLLCDPNNLPALLNCAHGKDRTGIVSALILSCAGRSSDYIADEYALSHDGLATIRPRIFKEMVERYQLNEEFMTASADTMQELIEYIISRYGSVRNYLEYIGFGSSEQEILRLNVHGTHSTPSVSTLFD